MNEMMLLQMLPQLIKMPEERLSYNAKKQEFADQKKVREYELEERKRQDSLNRKAQKRAMKQQAKGSYISNSDLYNFLVSYDKLNSYEKRNLLNQLNSSRVNTREEKTNKTSCKRRKNK